MFEGQMETEAVEEDDEQLIDRYKTAIKRLKFTIYLVIWVIASKLGGHVAAFTFMAAVMFIGEVHPYSLKRVVLWFALIFFISVVAPFTSPADYGLVSLMTAFAVKKLI